MYGQNVTPASSFTKQPLTPPPTDKKPFAQALRIIALFRDRQAGRDTKQDPWTEFQLVPGEYAEVERLLSHDEALSGFVENKIRYVHSIVVGAAANHMYTVMTTTQKVVDLFFECRPAYMSSLLTELKTQFVLS
jgi:hypothetical protein